MAEEFEPLFAPGFHDLARGDLEPHFIDPFPGADRRVRLLAGLSGMLSELEGLGIEWEVWLDGSFSTKKPDPNDIDVLVIADGARLNELPIAVQQRLRALLLNPQVAKVRFGCEVYFADSGDPSRLSYWRGWFGFSRNETPKGIPRLRIA